METKKNILTIKEIAEILSMSPSGVYQWVAAKKIPYIKVGSIIRFDRREIDKWLENNSVEVKK